MKYVIVSSSLQENSQSLKVSRYLSEVLKSYSQTEASTIIDLEADPLPLWDNSFWKGDAKWKDSWAPKQDLLVASDAMIWVTPEYNGMASPSLKNFLLFVSNKEVGHKPTLIVSVAAAAGGAYPIAELRASGYKNPRICYIPEHIVVRGVGKVLNEENSENDPKSDSYIRGRINFTLKILETYALAFKKNILNQPEILFDDKYVNGM